MTIYWRLKSVPELAHSKIGNTLTAQAATPPLKVGVLARNLQRQLQTLSASLQPLTAQLDSVVALYNSLPKS